MEPETKPWWQSKTIIGAVVTGASMLLGALFGIKVDAATQLWIVDQSAALIAAWTAFFGIILSIYGRVVAKRPIGPASANPQRDL